METFDKFYSFHFFFPNNYLLHFVFAAYMFVKGPRF